MQKKRRILVLRTAKIQVIDLLMEKIDRNDEVTFLVQKNMVDEIGKRYPSVKVVSIMDNYFNYISFYRNVSLTEKYDAVYVPASGTTFDGYEEVFSILENIKYKKLILFNGKGEESMEWNTKGKVVWDFLYSIFAGIYMRCIDIWYECFGRKYKF